MTITNTYVRNYPFGALASHILGYVGEISPGQLKSSKGYVLGDKVGQAGIESSFDKELRGQPGLEQLRVDLLGRPISPIEMRTPVTPGYAVRLTLDAKLQQAAQQAIVDGINLAQRDHQWYAKAGAIVALDPRDGAIRALASYPTFDPEAFTSHKKGALDFLTNSNVAKADDYPALDRAIAGAYPPGSTFKPVTALAAMQEHILQPYNALQCTGSYKVAGQVFNNWDPFVNQSMTLPTAIAQSCDTYFYQVGKAFYDLPADRGQPLQRWAKTFGFGQQPGLDVGPATAGLLPTIAWKHATFTKKTDPRRWQVDRLWKPGDSIQLAIGQKDMLASPLQMARFYALLANGGKLVTPHLVSAIEQPGPSNGLSQGSQVLRRYQAPTKELNLDPGAITADPRRAVRGDALRARHLREHLRPLPGSDRRQDRNLRDARGIRLVLRQDEHVLVVRLRPVRRAAARRLRGDRERRLRRRGRGAHGPQGVRAVLREEGHQREHGADGLMADYAADRRLGGPPARPRAREHVPAQPRLGAPGSGRRDRRLRPLGDLRDHEGRHPRQPDYYVVRQAAYALVGCAGLAGMTLIDPGFWRKYSRVVYGVLIAMLVLTPVLGSSVRNTRRWIDFGRSASSRPSSGSSCSSCSWPRSSPIAASGSTSGGRL